MNNKPALLVIDFINDVVSLESKIAGAGNAAFAAEHQVIERANQAIELARAAKIPVIFIKLGFSQGYPECPPQSPMFGGLKDKGLLQLGTWSSDYHPDLAIRVEDISVVKHRVSAFYNTDLESILRAQGIDTVIIAGVSTAMAVEHTVRDAHDRDYQVIVLSDACAAVNQAQHDAALMLMGRLCKIIKTTELTGELS